MRGWPIGGIDPARVCQARRGDSRQTVNRRPRHDRDPALLNSHVDTQRTCVLISLRRFSSPKSPQSLEQLNVLQARSRPSTRDQPKSDIPFRLARSSSLDAVTPSSSDVASSPDAYVYEHALHPDDSGDWRPLAATFRVPCRAQFRPESSPLQSVAPTSH